MARLQCVAVCCNMAIVDSFADNLVVYLQCVTVCRNVSQCAAVCCSVLQCVDSFTTLN